MFFIESDLSALQSQAAFLSLGIRSPSAVEHLNQTLRNVLPSQIGGSHLGFNGWGIIHPEDCILDDGDKIMSDPMLIKND